MSEDDVGKGGSGSAGKVTGLKGGQADSVFAFGNANIKYLSVHNHQPGSDDAGQSKPEPKYQVKDDFGDAVLVRINGRRSKAIGSMDINQDIPVQEGKVLIRGKYGDENIDTAATCKNGLIVHLGSDCGEPRGSARSKSIWKLCGFDSDVISKLIANGYRGLIAIKNATKDIFRVLWVRMSEGSLILEFGHAGKEDAEEMVNRKDYVTLLLKSLLGNYNIHDNFRVDCETEVMDECDVVLDSTQIPPAMEEKGKQHAVSESDSDTTSVSSVGGDTDSVLGDLLTDEDVDGCDVCQRMRKDRVPEVSTNQVVIHTDVATMMPFTKSKRDKQVKRQIRDKKQFEMASKISAVRNSGGGCILCHICGRDKQDRRLQSFDELLSPSINLTLGAGEIFSHVIEREWYRDTDFVIIKVPRATFACIANANSCVANQFEHLDISRPMLKTLLFGKYTAGRDPPLIRGLKDLEKGVCTKFKRQIKPTVNASEQFYTYSLSRWISAFSKNPSGGSIYIGINERSIKYSDYFSTILEKPGSHIAPRDHITFTKELKSLVRENMMIIPNIHAESSCDLSELVDVAFHHISEENYVIEISVRSIYGCVFTDKRGPFAYKLDEKGSLCRMSNREWMEKLRAE